MNPGEFLVHGPTLGSTRDERYENFVVHLLLFAPFRMLTPPRLIIGCGKPRSR